MLSAQALIPNKLISKFSGLKQDSCSSFSAFDNLHQCKATLDSPIMEIMFTIAIKPINKSAVFHTVSVLQLQPTKTSTTTKHLKINNITRFVDKNSNIRLTASNYHHR